MWHSPLNHIGYVVPPKSGSSTFKRVAELTDRIVQSSMYTPRNGVYAVVRNPAHRLVSTYFFTLKLPERRGKHLPEKIRTKFRAAVVPFVQSFGEPALDLNQFQQYCHRVVPSARASGEGHYRSQHSFQIPSVPVLEYWPTEHLSAAIKTHFGIVVRQYQNPSTERQRDPTAYTEFCEHPTVRRWSERLYEEDWGLYEKACEDWQFRNK